MITPQKIWREKSRRYRLEASKCIKCSKVFFPPRLVCPECKVYGMELFNLPLKGKIVSWTLVSTGHPAFRDLAPYALVIVEVLDGVKILMSMSDFTMDDLKIGKEVNIEFRKIQEDGESGVIAYGYKAVPCLE